MTAAASHARRTAPGHTGHRAGSRAMNGSSVASIDGPAV
jgi:hypothetical protein